MTPPFVPPELNDHFGTAEDLKLLSDALHSRGMRLMLDVVVNHVAVPVERVDGRTVPVGLLDGQFVPPPGYGAFSRSDHFHPHCWIRDYDNATDLEQCWIGDGGPLALADLDTENEEVVEELLSATKDLVERFNVDVLRVDTVKHGEEDPCFASSSWQNGSAEFSDSPQGFLAAVRGGRRRLVHG
jgi:alpha-amylase